MSVVTVTKSDGYREVFYAVESISWDGDHLVIKFKEEGHATYIPMNRIAQVDVR